MLNGTKNDDIILIKRRKAGHGGHHGGAWKVAYADFVTALMSLFIVLWLTSTSDVVKKSIAQYFNDPKGTSTLQGTNLNGAGHSLPMDKSGMEKLKQKLMEAAQQMPNFDKLKNQVEITAEQDGLRIELLEQPGGTFFKSGNAEPTPALRDFLKAISPQLGEMKNRISIEGHTDSVPYSSTSTYTNWELSTDRANAARRLMQSSGVVQGQVAEVRGFADQMPRRPDAPNDPSNRRITLVIEPSSILEPAAQAKEMTTGKEMGPDGGKIAAAASGKGRSVTEKSKVK
jgi:chemotaxis protein MotB